MATEEKALAEVPRRASLIESMAARFSMEPAKFAGTVLATCFPQGKATNEQFAAFLAVAHEYNLNPFTRELYAFPNRAGGIVPIVSIDGWVKLVVRHPDFNGMEFEPILPIGEDGKPDQAGKWVGCRCRIWRKGIPDRPAADITEWYDECFRPTDPWKQMHRRMMRHKALKEAARYAFGFAGITDEDEARDIINVTPESQQMKSATENKAADLRERLRAKREEAQVALEPEQPVVVADEPPPPDDGYEAELLETHDRTITESELMDFMDLVESRWPRVGGKMPEKVRAALHVKLRELGHEHTKDMRFSELAPMRQWVMNVKL